MIKQLTCKKCACSIKVDYSKAPSDPFVIACPSCQQRYSLKKPQVESSAPAPQAPKSQAPTQQKAETPKQVGLNRIVCVKCKKGLSVDFSKVKSYPCIVPCKSCGTKIRFDSAPGEPSKIQTGKLDALKKTKSIKIDVNAIDPKNTFAYKVFRVMKLIPGLDKVGLLFFLGYLIREIIKTVSKVKIDEMSPEYFIKLKMEVNTSSGLIYSSSVNPIISEAGISPRYLSWANNWFIKKLSSRLLIAILENNRVDMSKPYIKAFKGEVDAENAAIVRFFTAPAAYIIYFIISLYYAAGNIDSFLHVAAFGVIVPYVVLTRLEYRLINPFFHVSAGLLLFGFLLDKILSSFNDFGLAVEYSAMGYLSVLSVVLLIELVDKKWPSDLTKKVFDFIHKIEYKLPAGMALLMIIYYFIKN